MDAIKEKLQQVIKKLFNIDFDVEVTATPEGMKADYASNAAMKLTRELHKNPREIAELIAGEMQEFQPEIAGPGFLNFTLPNEYFIEKMQDLEENFEKNISCDEYFGKTVICEFSDPNPFKVLHVGHLYTSMVGDAISRLFEYAGAKVVRANFGGDVGLHVAKNMWALLKRKAEFDALATVTEKVELMGRCYVEGTNAYEDDEVAKKEITELNKRLYEINRDDIHGEDVADLYWEGRKLSYEYFEDFYAKLGLKFDKYYPESTVADLGLSKVKEELVAGVYEESDGAVIFDGEKYGLHKRVFINREGVPTYESKDVGLIFRKWDDYKFDKSVIITADEQLEYMKVVLKSIEQYAPELVAKTTHLTHGIVKLPGNEKMSSRKGNFLRAVDVLNMVFDALKTSYNSADEKVALGAAKYAFLKYKMGGNIIFDPKESVKMTGNSGPYLQYSCVRAKKILSKCEKQELNEKYEINSNEKKLMKKILEYKEVLAEAVAEMAPHKVTGYLYELAQEFSRFYEKCPVAGSEFEAQRAKLVAIYLRTMLHGLNLLGIEVPEAM